MCPQYTDAPLTLVFFMFSGPCNWGKKSILAIKLERSYQVDWTSASSKTTLTKNFNLKQKQVDAQTRKHNAPLLS